MNPIYTIGYGGRSMDEFIGLLTRYEIAYLIDVRSIPASKMYPEFSQHALDARLAQQSITYVFMGDLLGGRPADPDCYTPAQKVDYERVKTKAFFQQGITRLLRAAEGGHRVALMCSELRPQECHRAKLIGPVLDAQGVEILHIDEDGATQTQAQVIELVLDKRLRGGQLSLFEDDRAPRLTSRKSYTPDDPHDD
jgi:uncharacterized protein (DUF488 family)